MVEVLVAVARTSLPRAADAILAPRSLTRPVNLSIGDAGILRGFAEVLCSAT